MEAMYWITIANVVPAEKSVKILLGCLISTTFSKRNFLVKSAYYIWQIMVFCVFHFFKTLRYYVLCSFTKSIYIVTVIIKETVLWNIVRWHCKTVVYVSMLCSTEPTKKHSVLMSLLVNGEDPPTGYSVRKPQQHQVRSWVSLTLRYPLQKKRRERPLTS